MKETIPRRPYRLAKRSEDQARTRDSILSAASELLLAAGSEVSLEEVAERAGVARPTIYRHFGSRAQLIRALIADISARVGIHRAVAEATASEDAGDAFARFVDISCDVWERESELIRGFLRLAASPDIAVVVKEANSARGRDALTIAKRVAPRKGRLNARDLGNAVTLLTSPQSFDFLVNEMGLDPPHARALLRRTARALVD